MAPPAGTGTPTATGPVQGTATGTVVGTATGTAIITAPIPTVTRSPSDPLVNLRLIEPKAQNKDNPPIYPIGQDISFSWDYDRVPLLPPTNLTMNIYPVGFPKKIYTIAAALPGSTTNYTWLGTSQRNSTNGLDDAIYNLMIYDGAVGPNGYLAGGGGYLVTYTGFKFGLYNINYQPGNRKYLVAYLPTHLSLSHRNAFY